MKRAGEARTPACLPLWGARRFAQGSIGECPDSIGFVPTSAVIEAIKRPTLLIAHDLDPIHLTEYSCESHRSRNRECPLAAVPSPAKSWTFPRRAPGMAARRDSGTTESLPVKFHIIDGAAEYVFWSPSSTHFSQTCRVFHSRGRAPTSTQDKAHDRCRRAAIGGLSAISKSLSRGGTRGISSSTSG